MLKNKLIKLLGMFTIMGFLAAISVWMACSKTGTINPIAPALQVEIDSIYAYPTAITGGYSSYIYVHVIDKQTRAPKQGIEVRFSTNYGVLVAESDITDNSGWATTIVQTPVDSLRHIAVVTAIVYESERKSVQVYVYETGFVEPTQIIVTVENDSVIADNGVSFATVRARLLDANSNPVPGERVTFSTDDPEIVIEPINGGITDSLGIARARIPSPSTPRIVRVYGRYGSLTGYADVTFIERARISIINLISQRYRLTANGSDSTIITAQVYTNYGTTAPDGTRITFRTTAGTLAPITTFKSIIHKGKANYYKPATTQKKGVTAGEVYAYTHGGIARVKLISSTTVDTAIVVALADSAQDSVRVYFDPGAPARITLVASNPTIIANGRDSTFVDAIVRDEFGNSVGPNIEITFTTTLGTIEPSALTNINGVARAILRSGTNSGYATVTARWSTSVSAHTTVFFASTVARSIMLQINPQSITADGVSQAQLRAQVLDRNSYPVSDGVPVIFEATRGILSLPRAKKAISRTEKLASPGATLSSIVAFTSGGWVEAILTSTTRAETSIVVAHTDTSGITTASDTSWVAFLPGEARTITVRTTRPSLIANGADTCWVEATVYDQFGNPILSGTRIIFSTSSGRVTPDSATTGADGTARTLLVSSRTVGRVTISARVGTILGTAYIDFLPSTPSEIVLFASLPRIPADGSSKDTIIARVLDSSHYPVSDGTPIIFTVDNGDIASFSSGARKQAAKLVHSRLLSSSLASRCVSFTRDGIAKAILTSSTIAGFATIIATSDTTNPLAPSDTIQVQYLPGEPHSITLTTSRPALVANSVDTCWVEAQVFDIFGNHLLSGITVNFSVSSGTVNPIAALTDSNGIARTLLTSGLTVERATITAQVGTIIRQAYIDFLPSTPYEIILSVSSSRIPADGSSTDTITAMVFDDRHLPVSDGTTVLFSTDNGILSGVGSRMKTLPRNTREGLTLRESLLSTYRSFTTGGVARAILTSSTRAGVATVIGTTDTTALGGPADTVYVYFTPGAPSIIELTASPGTIAADSVSRAEIRATVYDSYRNPVGAGVSVEFSTDLGRISPTISITDSNGVAVSYLTSGTQIGTATVQAVSGSARGMTLVYFVGSTPAHISLWTSTSTVQIGSGQVATIYGFVTDSLGRAVSDGTPVDFRAIIGNIPLARGYTSRGIVQVSYEPARVAGIDTINATSGLAQGKTTIRIEAGEVTYIDLTPEPDTIAADGRSQSVITAILTDRYGNRVSAGREVKFTTDLGSIIGTVYSDSTGIARSRLTSAAQIGRATVEARSERGLAQTYVEFVSAPASFISLSADSLRLTANGTSTTRIIARILDSRGQPSADGTIVIFHSYREGTTAPFGTIDTLGVSSGGQAIVNLRSGTSTGRVQVIASLFGIADTIYIDFVPGGVARIELNAEPDSIPADGRSQSRLTATLYDAYSNRLGQGRLVTFTTSNGTLDFSQVYTDSTGSATITLTSSTTIGQAQITASAGGYSTNIIVWFTRLFAATIDVVADPSRIPADGVSISTIRATLLDSTGSAVPDNTPVRFSTTGGVLFPGVGYTSGGVASVTLRSSTTPQIATVRADAGGGIAGQTNVEFVPGSAERIELEALPSSIPADGDTTSTIIATVYDRFGHPVQAGIPVRFTTSLGTIDSLVYTNDVGEARAILRAGTIPGTAQIYATSGTAFGQIQVNLTNTEAGSIYLTITPAELVADRRSVASISGIVRNSIGMPITDGSPIILTVSPDTLGRATPSIVYTDSGRFSGTFVAGKHAGSCYVVANAGAVMDSVSVTLLPGVPESIEVSVSPTSIIADSNSTATIVATLYDRYGNHVSGGHTVNFTTTLGYITPSTDITDRNGTVRAVLRSGRVPGVARVRINSGVARAETTIVFLSSMVGTIILTSSPQQIVANGLNYSTLEATVLDTLGDFISDGTPILFRAEPETLGYLVARVGYTQQGKATSIYRAGRQAGEVRLIAYSYIMHDSTTDTISGNTILRLIPGPVDSLLVSVEPESIPADGRSTSRITATVKDAFGNNVGAGHMVTFSTTAGTITPQSVYTNSSGIATTTLTAPVSPGVALISASCEGVWEVAEITFIPTGVSNMLLSANPVELVANGINQSIITATVYDSAGNYVSDGTLIRFEIVKPDSIGNYGNIVSTRPTVGGSATTTYTSGTRESAIYIRASSIVGSDTLVDSVQVRLLAGPPATIDIRIDSTELHANGQSIAMIEAHIYDLFGNPVRGGLEVRFSSSLGTITPSSITDTAGVARAQLRADYTIGEATITVTCYDAIGFGQVRFVPTTAQNIILVVDKPTLVANGEDTTRVTASVYDPGGNLCSDGVPVYFEIQGPIPGGHILPSRVLTTGGKAQTTLRADTVAVGQRLVRAYVVQGTDTFSATYPVKFIAGPPVNITITPEDSILPADGVSSTNIEVRAYDRFSNRVNPGTIISFTTSLGSITSVGVIDTSGRTSAILTSSNQVGVALITARSSDATAYTQVRFSELVAHEVDLIIIPHSLPGDGASSAEIVATVLDSVGNPVSDRTRVRFYQHTAYATGRIIPSTAYTEGGVARSTFYAPTAVGRALVFAEARAGVYDSFFVDLIPGPPSIIEFDPSVPDTLLADGMENPIVVYVYDAYRNPVALGTDVQFSTTRGTILSPVSVYDTMGTTMTFISSNEVGSAVISVRSGEAFTSKRIDFIPIRGAYLYLSANPTTLVADGSSQSILTAVVVDSQYRPVSDGIPVYFYSYGSGRLDRRTVQTRNGIASINITSGTITGKDTVIARLSQTGPADTVILNFIPGPPASVQFTTPPHDIYAGGDTTSFIVRVLDRYSNPVLAGTRVTFETTLGTITAYAVTDDSGYARGALTSGTAMGVAFITARSGEAYGYATVNILATTADTLILSANPRTITADGVDSTILTAMVLDSLMLPVSDGTLVRFTTTAGILSSPAVYTLNGIARTALISGIHPDTALVRASAGGSAMDTVHVAFRAGPPAIIEISSRTYTVKANGSDTTTVTVRVYDQYGNRVGAGVEITLTTTGGGSITSPAYTDLNGEARAVFTSSRRPGWSQVIASTGTASASITIGMVPENVATVILTVSPLRIQANGTDRATVTVTVLDSLNRPAADGTPVLFDSLSYGIVIPQRVETVDGTASAQLTAFTQVGIDTLFAHATPDVFDSVTIQFLAGPPAIATLTPDTDVVLADGVSTHTVRAVIKDIVGHPVDEGYSIEFTLSPDYMGTIRSIAITNSVGQCSTIFRPSRIPGVATIYAKYEGRTLGVAQILCQPINAQSIILSVDKTRLSAGGADYTDVQALVLDTEGHPVSDSTGVFFALTDSSTAGIVFPGWSQTIGGIARTKLISTTNKGEAYLYATTGTGVTSDTIKISIVPSSPARIYFTPTEKEMIADGISTIGETLYVEDAFGNRVPEALVDMSIGAGTLSPTSALTDRDSGSVILTIRAPSRATTTQLRASSGGAVGIKNVTFKPTPIEGITISAYPSGLPATGIDTSSITAVLTTTGGRPVSDGIQVWFTTTAGYITPTDTTVSGRAYATLFSANTSTTARVCAKANDITGGGVDSACTYVVFSAGPPDSIYAYVKKEPDTTRLPGITVKVGSTERIKVFAVVYDRTGNPVAPGTVVHLSIDSVAYGSLNDTVLTTNSAGICSTYFNPGTKTGIAWVRISTDNGKSASVYIRLIAEQAQSLELSVNPSAIFVRGAGEFDYSVISAYIVDRFGNPVRDSTKVYFALVNYPGTLPGERPTLEPTHPSNPLMSDTILTLNGRANVTLRSGSVSGTVIVAAYVDTISSRAPRITIRSGLPARISLSYSDCNVPGLTQDGLVDSITAMVMDSRGNPVSSGTAVYFSTNSGLVIGSDTTDTNGFAHTIWYSSDPRPSGGKVYIRAETRGEGTTVVVDSVWFYSSGRVNSLVSSASPASVFADGTSQSIITVKAYDANGNPVVDMTSITLSATLGSITSPILTGGECDTSKAIATFTSPNPLTYDNIPTDPDLGDSAVITIRSGAVTTSQTIYLKTGPPNIERTSIIAPSSVPYNASAAITVRVVDSWNNPLANVQVTLSASSGSVSGSPRQTNRSGYASFIYTAPGSGTMDIVTATLPDGTRKSISIALTSGKAKEGADVDGERGER